MATTTRTRSAGPTAGPAVGTGLTAGTGPTASTGPTATAGPTRASRRRRRGAEVRTVPLGSLTQRGSATAQACTSCGSPAVTTLSITLTDGTPARFASCRACGHRHWADDEGALSISDVLVRTTKA